MIEPVDSLIQSIIWFVIWVLIVGAVLSWLVAFDVVNTRNKLVSTVLDVTTRISNPLLAPIRKVVPTLGGVDLSPVVLIFGLTFVGNLVAKYINF
jgi:YggT family protein